VRAADGYPAYWPSDPFGFIAPPYEQSSWVADLDDAVVGHVAVHDAAVDPVLPTASAATGLGASQLAVVARLLVAPEARRDGVGTALLATATKAAHIRRQRPVLDVGENLLGAIAFYEAAGWVSADRLIFDFPDAPPVVTLVYVGPEPEQ
jgi:GNAT superfamily N-acetyltransferase